MIRKLIAFIICTSSTVMAADSNWLLCSNDSLAISSFEHRNGVENRETHVNLLFGMHMITGNLVNTNSGDVILSDKINNNYRGKISIDYAKKVIILKGTLTIYDEKTIMKNLKLKCKELNGKKLK